MNSDSRNWAMFAHLTAIIGGFVGGIGSWVGPLVIWLIKKDEDPFVAEHGREALNFNLLVLALGLAAIVVAFLTLGIGLLLIVPLALVVGVVWLVFSIQGAIAAYNGRPYRYPLNVRIIR